MRGSQHPAAAADVRTEEFAMRRSSTVPRSKAVILWALAAVILIATGTAYASGFVASASTAADPNHGAATPLLGNPPTPELELYPNAVAITEPVIAFDVLWGQLAHDTMVFTLTLPANDSRTGIPYPGGTAFSIDVYATNQPDLMSGAGGHTPWTKLAIQWTLAPCPGGVFHDETSLTPTFSSPTAQAVMAVTSGVIHVELPGLAPATVYCAGVKRAYPDANDVNGTYLTRPYATDADATAANAAWSSAVPVAPIFTATIRRTA
jgi:hypothetical protein